MKTLAILSLSFLSTCNITERVYPLPQVAEEDKQTEALCIGEVTLFTDGKFKHPLEKDHSLARKAESAKTDLEKLEAEVHMHRLWGGEGGIVEMVASGQRDPKVVARILQAIKEDKFRFGNGARESLSVHIPAKSLQELISAGNFGYVNPNITEVNFPDIGADVQDPKVYDFGKNASSEYATDQMEKDDYRPANLRELLIWMIANWNGKDLVVALGQSRLDPYGRRSVPCLGGWLGGRDLGLSCLGGGWSSYFRFLAFRKSSRR